MSLKINNFNNSLDNDLSKKYSKLSPRIKEVEAIQEEKEEINVSDFDDFIEINKNDTIDKDKSFSSDKSNDNSDYEKEKDKEKNLDENILNIIKELDINKDYFFSFSEKLLCKLQPILLLFNQEENSVFDLKDAKDSLKFYSLLSEINSKTRNPINSQLRHKRNTKSYYHFGLNKTKINSKDFSGKNYFSVLDWKKEEIGETLIKITKDSLNKIHKRELYKAIYMKKEKYTTSPNVMENINKFNRLTSFVIEDILSYDFAKDRAKMIDKWAQICNYLRIRKDYNDCLAIFASLNSYIITGLKLTSKELKSKTNSLIKNLAEFCTCEGNYKNIREDMKKAIEDGDVFVPYLGMILRDITFYEEKEKYINDNGLINIEKIQNIEKLIDNYFKFKKTDDLTFLNISVSNISELNFFNELYDQTEEDLDSIANQLEPEFKINFSPKSEKRLTEIDKKFFSGINTNKRKSFISNITFESFNKKK